MNIEKFFDKTYDKRNYTCANFVVDVWKELFGDDLYLALLGPRTEEGSNRLDQHTKALLERLHSPCEPCIALFQAPRLCSHVGVLIQGKVLSLGEEGVTWQTVESLLSGFNRVRFYGVKKTNNR